LPIVRTNASAFEAVFARYAGPIPLAYLRSLAYKESGFRPDVVHPTSKATGLFQITRPALKDFNGRRGTRYVLEHLKNPELNTAVAAQHLASVIATYSRHPALLPDWSSRRWVELLTIGWNAGHNAVVSLVSKLAASRIPPERITVEAVSQLARATGKGKYVADPKRVAWAKAVATMFLGGGVVPAPAGPRTGPLVARMGPGGGGVGAAVGLGVALVLAVGASLSKWAKGREGHGPDGGRDHEQRTQR
jgi:hypothetical protein